MPTDPALASVTPLRGPTAPPENHAQVALALPGGDPASYEVALHARQAPRIEAPAPEDTASGAAKVAEAPAPPMPPVAEPMAVSAGAARLNARPTLHFAATPPDSRHHVTLAPLVGDPVHPDGVDYALQAPPTEPPALVVTAKRPKVAKTTPVRSSRRPARSQAAGEPFAPAERVKRIALERAVEDMLRDRILRK